MKQEAAEANRAHFESVKSRMMEKVGNFEKQKAAEYAKERERCEARRKEVTETLAEGENARRDAEGKSAQREELAARLRDLTESFAEEERARADAARGTRGAREGAGGVPRERGEGAGGRSRASGGVGERARGGGGAREPAGGIPRRGGEGAEEEATRMRGEYELRPEEPMVSLAILERRKDDATASGRELWEKLEESAGSLERERGSARERLSALEREGAERLERERESARARLDAAMEEGQRAKREHLAELSHAKKDCSSNMEEMRKEVERA